MAKKANRFKAYRRQFAAVGLVFNVQVVLGLKKCQKSVWTFVSHTNPHLDEIGAMWMLDRFTSIKFDLSKTEFWGSGSVTPDGRSWQDHVNENKLMLGCGGNSPFNEHTIDGIKLKKGLSCMKLVAIFLGLQNHRLLTMVIGLVNKQDLKGGGKFDTLAKMIKSDHLNGVDQLETIQWVFKRLDNHFKDQIRYFQAKAEVADGLVNVQMRQSSCAGRPINIASVHSDSCSMGAALRSQLVEGKKTDLVVQKKSCGRVMIFVNKRSFIGFEEFVNCAMLEAIKLIRTREAEMLGLSIPDRLIGAEGGISLMPQWFYYRSGDFNLILNGSESAVDVAPTIIALPIIVKFLAQAFSSQ